MKVFGFISLFLAQSTLAQNTCGINKCCEEKVYGGYTYKLVAEENTAQYDCLQNCVYEKQDRPGSRFCFAAGGDEYPKCIKDTLAINNRLGPGDKIQSKNGLCSLTMEKDGILVLRNGANIKWQTPDEGSAVPNSTFYFQNDGNLVIYDGPDEDGVAYSAVTYDKGGVLLVLDNFCHLTLYKASCEAIWKNGNLLPYAPIIKTDYNPNFLHIGDSLQRDERLSSRDRKCNFVMDAGGDLTLTLNGNPPQFASNTDVENSIVKFKNDGNLVVQGPNNGTVQFETGTAGKGAVKLVVQNDCVTSLFTNMCKPVCTFFGDKCVLQ